MSNLEKHQFANKSNRMSFGDRLHEALGRKSYKAITEQFKETGVNIDYDSIRRYIVNERMPTVENLLKISEFTGVSVDWLLKGNLPDYEIEDNLTERLMRGLTSIERNAFIDYSKKKKLSLNETASFFISEGLMLRGLIPKTDSVRFYSNRKSKHKTEIPLWGIISDSGFFEQVNHTVEVPVNVLKNARVDGLKIVHHAEAHAILIDTDQYESEGVMNGDYLVTARLDYDEAHYYLNDVPKPVLVIVNDLKAMLGRFYKDGLNEDSLLHIPLRQFEPVVKSPLDSKIEFEAIVGVVKNR